MTTVAAVCLPMQPLQLNAALTTQQHVMNISCLVDISEFRERRSNGADYDAAVMYTNVWSTGWSVTAGNAVC